MTLTKSPSKSILEMSPFSQMVEINPSEQIAIDLRYASTNNFAGRNFYGSFNRCYLHSRAAEMLYKVAEALRQERPGWKLLLLDCLRPRSVQFEIWKMIEGTDARRYFADPARGSVHNYGFAVDLTLLDSEGREVDMGTIFDHFGIEAEPQHEQELLKRGVLTEAQVGNRLILRRLMTDAGFIPLKNEWWHFDAVDRQTLKQYEMVESI